MLFKKVLTLKCFIDRKKRTVCLNYLPLARVGSHNDICGK
jgi:hypothetical protein